MASAASFALLCARGRSPMAWPPSPCCRHHPSIQTPQVILSKPHYPIPPSSQNIHHPPITQRKTANPLPYTPSQHTHTPLLWFNLRHFSVHIHSVLNIQCCRIGTVMHQIHVVNEWRKRDLQPQD